MGSALAPITHALAQPLPDPPRLVPEGGVEGARPRSAAPDLGPPGVPESLAAWKATERWIREWSEPAPGTGAFSGVCVTIRDGRAVLGRGAFLARDDSERAGVLARAVKAAMDQARQRLALPQDALEESRLRERAAAQWTISLELAGPLVPFAARSYADVDLGVSPGLLGVGARFGDRLEGVFPSAMLATGLEVSGALRGAISDASKDPRLAVPGTPEGEPGAIAKAHGAVFYTFRTSHMAQEAPGLAPLFLQRGGEIVERRDLATQADAIARHLIRRLKPGLEARPPESGARFPAMLYPTLERYASRECTGVELCIASYALSRYAQGPGDPAERREAGALAGELLTKGVDAREFKLLMLEDPAFASAWLLASDALAPGSPGPDVAFLAMARPMVFGCFDEAKGWNERAIAPARPLIAYAMAADARRTGDASRLALARAAVRSIFRESQPAQLVSAMPWLGWAELAITPPGEDVAAGIALREMRETLRSIQIDPDAGGTDDADLVGGFVFAGSGLLPTWHSTRPLAFLVTMLRDERLTTRDEFMKELLPVVRGVRFTSQLSALGPERFAFVDRIAGEGGVRAAPWDPAMPIDASSLALLTLVEMRHCEAEAMRRR